QRLHCMTVASSFATDESQPRRAFFPSASGKLWTAAWDYVTGRASGSPRSRTPWLSSYRRRQALFPFATGAELSAISIQRRSASGSPKFCCTASMKRLILKNWHAKLISLLLATTLWYLIKKNVATTPSPSERPSHATTTERR